MRAVAILAILGMLSGCASVGDKALQAGTAGITRFSAVDVDAAISIAVQTKDAVAEGCFRAIRKHLDLDVALQEPVGPVSTYATARARIHEVQAGLAPEIHVACAPLVVDAGNFAASLGLTLGTLR